jgi:hypothetical protein
MTKLAIPGSLIQDINWDLRQPIFELLKRRPDRQPPDDPRLVMLLRELERFSSIRPLVRYPLVFS